MAKIIYHMGTGTYFGLDDDVYIIDIDKIDSFDAEIMDESGDEIAQQHGVPFTMNDVDLSNSISWSPSCMREEAAARLDNGRHRDEDEPMLRWILNKATDDQLNDTAAWLTNDTHIWDEWERLFWQGAEYLYEKNGQSEQD